MEYVMNKKYIVRLSDEERKELVEVITKLEGTSQKVKRAQILLKADVDGSNWPHYQIAEAFSPEQSRKIVERIEFHYTPKHGSWLNVAENELISMTRQCLKDRKMTNIDILRKETCAWATNSNDKQRIVNYQFKVEDARQNLRSLYPNI